MSAFERCQGFEQQVFEEYLRPFFADKAHSGLVTIEKSRHAVELQVRLGDLAFNRQGSREMLFVECKAERTYTGNLFLEEWSNRESGRRGWMFNNDADWLAYFFADVEVLYVID